MSSKQREALVAVKKLFDGRIMFQPAIRACHKQVNEALAEPLRECDRFADEKQADALHAAFIEHCNRCDCPMGCDHRKNPRFLLDGNCASIMKCFARFALSKATTKEGGAV